MSADHIFKNNIHQNGNGSPDSPKETESNARSQEPPYDVSSYKSSKSAAMNSLEPLDRRAGVTRNIVKEGAGKLVQYLEDHSGALTESEKRYIESFVYGAGKGYASTLPAICKGSDCPFIEACHPPGTKVLTSTRGYVNIESLNPKTDKVISFIRNNKKDRTFCLKGRNFELTHRNYQGLLHNIQTPTSQHEVTSDHICLVKWKESIKSKFIVYLMKRGEHFRIGMCQLVLKLPDGNTSFQLKQRVRSEDADKAWILGVYDTKVEALLAEDKLSCEWQTSKCLFIATPHSRKQNKKSEWVTQKQLDEHHNSCKKPLSYYSNKLNSIGLDINIPFFEKNRPKKSLGSIKRISEIRAINLIPEYMQVLENPDIHKGNDNANLSDFIVEKRSYSGKVYSLGVETDETYLANGIVTHNCPIKKLGKKLPVGSVCPVELTIIDQWLNKHLPALGIEDPDAPEHSFDMDLIHELAGQALIQWRCSCHLSETSAMMEEKQTSGGQMNDPIYETVIHPALEVMERSGRNMSKLREALVATREAQLKAGRDSMDGSVTAAAAKEKAKLAVKEARERQKLLITQGRDRANSLNTPTEIIKEADYEILQPEPKLQSEEDNS